MNDAEEAARKLFAGPCDFIWGATSVQNLPPETLCEVAFIGRSNAGKSSLINALTGRKNLARVSQTPGATRQINFFNLGNRLMLVDLPGYMVNYGLGAILTAEMRAHISEALGSFDAGDPRWYGWLSEHLLRFGSERETRTLMQDFLGRAVSPQAFLTQLHRLRHVSREAPGTNHAAY